MVSSFATFLVSCPLFPVAQEGNESASFYHNKATPVCLTFVDGDMLVAGSQVKEICIWKLKDKKETPFKVLKEHRNNVRCVTYSGPNAFVAAGPDGARHSTGEGIRTAKVVYCTVGPQMKTTVLQIPGSHVMDLSPGGKYLVVRGDFGMLLPKNDRRDWYNVKSASVYKIPSEEKVMALEEHDGEITDIKFAPDQKTLATVTVTGRISIWDLEKRKKTSELISNEKWVPLLAFSPDLKYLFSSNPNSANIQKWDLFQKKVVQEIPIRRPKVFAVSPDGSQLAVGALSEIWVFDAFTCKEISHWNGKQGQVSCLCFSKDGKTLATGGNRGIIRLWKLPESKR
jgi:WD40 repeat protein